jgi:hypothetical protein
MAKPSLIQRLPNLDQPNIQIHVDLFRPILATGRQHKYILCTTDTFRKYTMVTAVVPTQMYTNGWKEFVDKFSQELFTLLNVQRTKTSRAHPQCNVQVDVFNKTIKKYLASFMDKTILHWENFLLALMLSYNFHSTITTMLFQLYFRVKPCLPSFSNPEIQHIHYSKE